MFCSICGARRDTMRGCCTAQPDVLADSVPVPLWDELDYPAQALICSLIRFGGQAIERDISRDVWLTGAQRREAVRDLDPPRGSTNLITRRPHGPMGITRWYRLTDAGIAAFLSRPDLRPIDRQRVRKIERQLANGLDSPVTLVVGPSATNPALLDWEVAPSALRYESDLESGEWNEGLPNELWANEDDDGLSGECVGVGGERGKHTDGF